MEGVTILQTFAHEASTWGWSYWFCVPILVCIVCGVCMVFAGTAEKPNGTIVTICMLGVLFSAFLTIGIAKDYTKLPTEYTYQVLLDKTVNMTEFAQRYEILEQQGITYIIKEKD